MRKRPELKCCKSPEGIDCQKIDIFENCYFDSGLFYNINIGNIIEYIAEYKEYIFGILSIDNTGNICNCIVKKTDIDNKINIEQTVYFNIDDIKDHKKYKNFSFKNGEVIELYSDHVFIHRDKCFKNINDVKTKDDPVNDVLENTINSEIIDSTAENYIKLENNYIEYEILMKIFNECCKCLNYNKKYFLIGFNSLIRQQKRKYYVDKLGLNPDEKKLLWHAINRYEYLCEYNMKENDSERREEAYKIYHNDKKTINSIIASFNSFKKSIIKI